MSAKSDDGRRDDGRRTERPTRTSAAAEAGTDAGARGSGRKRIGTRSDQYMIASARPGLPQNTLLARLEEFGGVEVLRTGASGGNASSRENASSRGTTSMPFAVVRMTSDKARTIRQSAGDTLLVETDSLLRAASLAHPSACAATVMNDLDASFTTAIQVQDESDEPIEHAQVHLLGQRHTAMGTTGSDGKLELTLEGELADTIMELIVKPRADYWGLWKSRPDLRSEAVNTISLRALSDVGAFGWGGQAARFDRLPSELRGAGVKIALIDSGVATGHPHLRNMNIKRGLDGGRGDDRAWSRDAIGHGTLCAGIIAASPGTPDGIRGYAPDAELSICELAPAARCSDLVGALDDCLEGGIDIICLGYGCEHGSAILEQRIMAASRQGIALIAAAGNSGGPVQFPACSPHVLAVGAIGQAGTFPVDSPHAACAIAASEAGGGLFVPAFSCWGPELDLCAPGVAVISCQSPEGHAATDGTSLAAAHVAAVAALVFAHHADFQRDFVNRDARKVGRLFQILKATAQPLGDPPRTGAGLLDAARALGLPARQRFHVPLQAGLENMRHAIRLSGVGGLARDQAPEPIRGPAFVTQLPLSAGPAAAFAGIGLECGMRDLKLAMLSAGLSTGQ